MSSVGFGARGLLGWKVPLLYAFGIGYRLGASAPGGFLYQVEILPAGFGVVLGESAMVGVFAGGALSGVTGREPLAWTLPAEALLELDVFDRIRIGLRGRAIFVPEARARQGGSEHAPFGDELEAALLLRWGRRYFEHDRRFSAGNGYYLGALYGERMGGRFFGVALGHSIDASLH